MDKQYIDGYLINFSSGSGYPTIWINNKNTLVHRYVWKKHNGEIPKGYIIHHLDENKNNFNIENLEIMARCEHSRQHALKNRLGCNNKSKPKNYTSGFCGAARPVILFNKNKSMNFESVSSAARFLKTRAGDVSRVAKGKRKTVKGWCCRYC